MLNSIIENIKDKFTKRNVEKIIQLMNEIQECADDRFISQECSLKIQLVLKDELIKLTVNNNERN